MNDTPMIVVGSGRCGTTLLVAMLNASGVVYIPYETSFLIRAQPHYGAGGIVPDDYPVLADLFALTTEKRGWELSRDLIIGELTGRRPDTLGEAIDTICRAYLDKLQIDGSVEWGLKRPLMICHLDRVYQCFPGAKVVHVVRDGRDVYLSYKALHEKSDLKFGPSGVVTCALYWIAGLRMAEPFESDLLTIRYEDLISRPEKELSRLEAFVTMPGLAEKCLSYEDRSAPSVVTDAAAQFIHQKVYQGVDASNAYKYKTRMNRFDRFVFEAVAAPYLKRYGYERAFSRLTWVFAPLRAVALWLSVCFNKYRYGRRDRRIFDQVRKTAS